MKKAKKRLSLLLTLLCAFVLVLSLGIVSACGNNESASAGGAWYYGAEVPAGNLGQEGDYYLDTETLTSYVKEGKMWRAASAEETGAEWFFGTGNPDAATGSENDFYFNTATGEVYQKHADSWGSVLLTLKGKDGRDGVVWFSGEKNPNEYEEGDTTLTDKKKGDFYLKTDDFTVWQLQDEWSPLGSIVGKGVQGFKAEGNHLIVTFTDGTEVSFELSGCFGAHTFGDEEPMTIIEAGCTNRGLVIKTCTVCGMTVAEGVEAKGHQFVDGVCSVCGKSQLEGHYETNEEGKCEVTISPDLIEAGGDLTIASRIDGEEVTVKEAVSEEAVEAQNYDFRTWLRGVSSAKTNPNVNLHIGTLVIEEGVNVGPGAFAGATIEHLVLEGNASYGAYAFDSVKGLKDVTIKGETTLGTTIFDNVPSLVSADMSEATITEIPTNAFYGCSSLSNVALPEAGLETIGINAFLKCSSLQYITLPEGLKTIKECAFSEADIREIIFPKSLSEIQIYAFQLDKNLSKAVFQSKIDTDTFGNNKDKTQRSPNTIFKRCGSREVPLQVCFTGSQDEWSEFEGVIDASNSQQTVYDYTLTEG